MKKISFIALFAAVIGMTMMSSCKKDEATLAPTITLNPSATSTELDFAAGDSVVKFSARVQAEGTIETFTINQVVTNLQGGTSSAAYDATTTSSFKGETDKTYDFEKTFTPADFTNASKYEYEFSVTDKDGKSYSITYTVTQKTGTVPTAITTHTNITIGDIAYNTTLGGYYSIADNQVYAEDAANASHADFGYLCGNSYPKCIFSIDVSVSAIQNLTQGPHNITPQRSTKFQTTTLTSAQFDAIGATTDDNNVIGNNVSSPTADYIMNIAAGNVIGFVTAEGKKGLLKIITADGTCGSTGLSITFDVKVQQ